MNTSPWRLEGVDGGGEQYPVESRFAVRHTSPDEQNPCFDRSTPTQVRFLRFAVRHTPPDQQDPRFDRRRSVSSVLRYARPLPMKTCVLYPTVGILTSSHTNTTEKANIHIKLRFTGHVHIHSQHSQSTTQKIHIYTSLAYLCIQMIDRSHDNIHR